MKDPIVRAVGTAYKDGAHPHKEKNSGSEEQKVDVSGYQKQKQETDHIGTSCLRGCLCGRSRDDNNSRFAARRLVQAQADTVDRRTTGSPTGSILDLRVRSLNGPSHKEEKPMERGETSAPSGLAGPRLPMVVR